MPKEPEIREALRPVVDPEIGVSVVDLGMIREIVLAEDGTVEVKMVLTTPFCPLASMIKGTGAAGSSGYRWNRGGEGHLVG